MTHLFSSVTKDPISFHPSTPPFPGASPKRATSSLWATGTLIHIPHLKGSTFISRSPPSNKTDSDWPAEVTCCARANHCGLGWTQMPRLAEPSHLFRNGNTLYLKPQPRFKFHFDPIPYCPLCPVSGKTEIMTPPRIAVRIVSSLMLST